MQQRKILEAALAKTSLTIMILVAQCPLLRPPFRAGEARRKSQSGDLVVADDNDATIRTQWELDLIWMINRLVNWRSTRGCRDAKLICGGSIVESGGLCTSISKSNDNSADKCIEQLVISDIPAPKVCLSSLALLEMRKLGDFEISHERRNTSHYVILQVTIERSVGLDASFEPIGSCDA
jgi:hypothetical protein|mmetsp:Transcript_35125/g.107816  ORF Transcript_35125/g.107816 Transcript_35125/m.107816 type:complete len:180 (-) Transcript_35125:292-831(-)